MLQKQNSRAQSMMEMQIESSLVTTENNEEDIKTGAK